MGIEGPKPSPPSPDLTKSPIRDVPLDTVYDVLRNRRRRLVLYYLVKGVDGTVRLGEMATQIAAWETEKPTSAVSATERKRTYNTLQQTHLPKLDDAGIVAYDHDRGTVELRADPKHLSLFLTVLPRSSTSFVKGGFIATAVVWLLLVVNWLGVHVFHAWRPGVSLGIVGIGILLILLSLLLIYRYLF